MGPDYEGSLSGDDVVFEDGGVLVDKEEDMIMTSDEIPTEPSNAEEYLQWPVISLNSPQLWSPPSGRLLNYKKIKRDQTNATAYLYGECYSLINNYWKCDFKEWIPEHLRAGTPYSLAMLYALRRLASNTKGSYETAQTAISRSWQERTLPVSALGVNHRFVERVPFYEDARYESVVQENLCGLTIMDVVNAEKGLKSGKFKDLPTAPQMKREYKGSRGNKGKRRAEQATERKSSKEKKKARTQANRRAAAAKSAVSIDQDSDTQDTKPEAFSQQFTLSKYDPNHQPKQKQDRPTANLSKKDKKRNNYMSRITSSMAVDRGEGVCKLSQAGLQRLQAGGRSRNKANTLLPSERTHLGNLPPLPALSALSSEQLTQLSKMSLDDIPG